MSRKIIAIDGYASTGKSTLAKMVAAELGMLYIDSGAMYRAIAWDMLSHKVDTNRDDLNEILPKVLEGIHIEFIKNKETKQVETHLNDVNIETEIRSKQVSDMVSSVAAIPVVRTTLVDMQRTMAKQHSVVMDGRDIGTVVFPEADLKVFLIADLQTRAQRRYAELTAKAIPATMEEVKQNLSHRDQMDITRTHSPLRKADDAKEIDNTYLSLQEQLQIILTWVKDN